MPRRGDVPNNQIDAKGKVHTISERQSPSRLMVLCTCGWRWDTLRQQNALARASKANAAGNKHLRSVMVTPHKSDTSI